MENLREITTGRINFVKLVDVAKYNKFLRSDSEVSAIFSLKTF